MPRSRTAVARFHKRKFVPAARPPAAPLKCPKCGAPASQHPVSVSGTQGTLLDRIKYRAVRVLCSADESHHFNVMMPKFIRAEVLE